MNNNANEVVGICGLFCKTCPKFAEDKCHGCLSDKVADTCIVCKHGFRDCIKEHNVDRCSNCGDFPCDRFVTFRDCHVENGISHHEHILEMVAKQKEIGIEAWAKAEEEKNTCPNCKTIYIWCENECRGCKGKIER